MSAHNIIDLLKDEHAVVKKLFGIAADSQDSERKDVLRLLKLELVTHARGEEKTVYSMLRLQLNQEHAAAEDILILNEAVEEHRLIDQLIQELEATGTSDERWMARLHVLRENVEHHIKEEEKDLFKLLKEHFSDERLVTLRSDYESAKEKYTEFLPSQTQIGPWEQSSDMPLF